MSEFDAQVRAKRARRGKHRGEPMSLLQQLRAGRRRRPRIMVAPTTVPGVRRSRRHAGS